MADYKAGVVKIQGEPETSCCARKKESDKTLMGSSQKDTGTGSMDCHWSNLRYFSHNKNDGVDYNTLD